MNAAAGWVSKAFVVLAFLFVLGVPWIVRPAGSTELRGADRLVILTPHNEQIRYEFARAFDRWHRRHHGAPVEIDWRAPGGTSEIRRLLTAQYASAIAAGRLTASGELAPGAEPMPYDMLFGGGSYELGEIKKGVRARPPAAEKDVTISMSIPMSFPAERLDEWYGENLIGTTPLYDPGDQEKGDPGQYWLSYAVSGFGIVFNRDVLRDLKLPDPRSWNDLTDPRLSGWLALADPRLSGSVATTYESILNCYGWDEGWRILRGMTANARYFSASSPRPPLDVSQGQAAAGTSIDFYGRYQSQALMRPGDTIETARVGYIDPPGEVFIDPDPICILRAGPNPEMARRFVEFILSEHGQALWNFPVCAEAASDVTADALGPEKYEIRRLPVRRVIYQNYFDRLVDKVNPFEIASKAPNKGFRSAVGPMIGAFSIDVHRDQIAAWRAIRDAQLRGAAQQLIVEARRMFYAWPTHSIPGKEGAPATTLEFNEKNYKAIRADWRDAEKDGRISSIRIEYASFFRAQYRGVVSMLENTAP